MATERHLIHKLEGGEGSIRLRKWSAAKFKVLNNEIGQLLQTIGSKVDSGGEDGFEFTFTSIGEILCSAGDEIFSRLTEIIRQSIDDPGDITTEQILDWDPEDYLVVASKIIEQNLTRSLFKKGGLVLAAIQQTFPMKVEKT